MNDHDWLNLLEESEEVVKSVPNWLALLTSVLILLFVVGGLCLSCILILGLGD